MENRSTILENRSNNSAVKIDNITSRDVARLSKIKKYKRLFALLITSLTWSTHWSELDMITPNTLALLTSSSSLELIVIASNCCQINRFWYLCI